MAVILQEKAAKALNQPTSTFYSGDKNPVTNAFQEEYRLFVQYMKKKTISGVKKKDDEPFSRGSNTLFNLWNSYEPRLPTTFYQQKVIEMGDFLVSQKEYKLAVWQCYGRYLDQFGDQHIEDIVDLNMVKEIFFPDGLETDNASLTFRALYGKSICNYQLVLQTDPKLQNTQSVTQCLKILAFLRLITQIVLPREPLCWLVYNGTIHIYSVSRHLMTLGHSAKVLEFLLWACMCMEHSVPLLSIRYLPWRTTLYTAVCYCYYDCKAPQYGESFARRALGKVNELSQLEKISATAPSPDTEAIFRQATVKLGTMVFRRTVFDARKRPKGLLRPKTRSNLKDAQSPTETKAVTILASDGRLIWHKTSKQRLDDLIKKQGHLPWPRTAVEKLLTDMFEGSAAQFMALLETLADSTRRTLLTSPAAPDTEDYVLDTFSELFFAGLEIISGGGGHNPRTSHGTSEVSLDGVVLDKSLIDLASCSGDGIPISAVVKFIKWAYNYEQWEIYDQLVELLITHIKMLDDSQYTADLKALEIMQAMEPLNPSRKSKKLLNADDGEGPTLPQPTTHAHGGHRQVLQDEMLHLAEVLLSSAKDPMAEAVDRDMVVDATLFLWSRCKAAFQKVQTGATDSGKYLQRMEHPNKWVYILTIVHEVMYFCGISEVDPGVTAEVAIRLAMVLENNATNEMDKGTANVTGKTGGSTVVSGGKHSAEPDEQSVSTATKESPLPKSPAAKSTISSELPSGDTLRRATSTTLYSTAILQQGATDQLLTAREILDRALQGMSYSREAVAETDGTSIADVSWVKDNKINTQSDNKNTSTKPANASTPLIDAADKDIGTEKSSDDEVPEAVHNTIMDLHLELIYMYHRVCLKLCNLVERSRGPTRDGSGKRQKNRTTSELKSAHAIGDRVFYIDTVDDLGNNCGKNLLSKALFFMQRALLMPRTGTPSKEQETLLQDALNLIRKAQDQESKLYNSNTTISTAKESGPPPAPLLVCRTDTTMVFKPAPYKPTEKVAWYRIFGRPASGSNVKVRLNDYFLPGSGQEVPAYDCELHISGLKTNERYVFAVAAYTAQGKLIGGSIGDTSKPVLCAHPLPVLMTYAFLSQAAYQIGCYSIAMTASKVLWDHFVAPVPPPESETEIETAQKDFKLTLRRLNPVTCSAASPVLLRMFLSGIFINVDVSMREGTIYCDKLCDRGPYYKGQLQRLGECGRMLIAMELAGWLNESNLALQAVVQCYGLLVPLLHYKIPSVPVIQVLTRCYAILEEIPVSLRQRRQQSVSDSLHHMIAVITYHMAKVLRTWKQRAFSNYIIDSGKKMLSIEKEVEKGRSEAQGLDIADDVDNAAVVQTQRKKRPKKTQVVLNIEGTQNEELRALEAHMLKLSKMSHRADDLSGSEDPNILHAFIATLPSRHAYKEVVKFRRRARYLEFFVQVVQKALSEGLVETAIEWCEETLAWLTKRNDQMLPVRTMIVRRPGAMTLAGDDPKKYAAVVQEYSKPKGNIRSPEAKSPRKKKRKFQLLVLQRSTHKMSEAAKAAQEQRELRAFEKLESVFPDFYHMHRRKQRLRKVCAEELPWRSQMNILQGLCHFALFLNKVGKRDKLLGPAAGDVYRSSYLDNEWFTLETANTLVVGWDGGPSRAVTRQEETRPSQNDPVIAQLQQLDIDADSKPHPSAIEVAALVTLGEPVPSFAPPPDDKESDTMKTYRSMDSDRPTKQHTVHHQQAEYTGITTQATLDSLTKTFDYLKKAVVLAHRGSHWTLLQNACRAMWNCAHTALLQSFAGGHNDGLMSVEALRGVVWKPFFMAVDCLLDMMFQLQNEAEKAKKKKHHTILVNTWVGTVADEKGGASLKFEDPLDDVSTVDTRWTRRMVLRMLEMLYYEEQWERLADVAMRYNVLTQERYTEYVSPLLIQAQRNLISRIKAYGGPAPPQPQFEHAELDAGEPITSKNYINTQLCVQIDFSEIDPIDMGGRIDPEGHNVYGGASDAFKLVCVPLDISDSLKSFREALDASNYTARALQHSRRLMVLYLATQQNAPVGGTTSRLQSRVGFFGTDDEPQMPVPPDLSQADFRTVADVQTAALPKSQLSVVLSSYDKTIEMMLARKQYGLSSQAMHELGNLHYHAGNIRAAYKWWAEALDLILHTTDTLRTWRQLLHKGDEQDTSAQLLERCGMWGCLLGAVLAAKIAQFILTSDLGLRMESCFLSAFLFKALFRTTLPHPTADHDYALYEIGEGCEVQYLVPGVDLFSDRFRCEGRTLVASLRWVTEELSRGRHNLMVLPLLTLYQYFTTYICRDLQRSVDGRILKVRILTDLGLYSEAFIVLGRLLHGERLPQTADSNFRQVEAKMSSQKFNTSNPLLEPVNLKMLEYLIEKKLSPALATLYGPHLTCHLSLAQAHFMVAIADTVLLLPDKEVEIYSSPEPQQVTRKVSPTPTSTSMSKPPPSVVSKKTDKAAPSPRITVDEALKTADDASVESVGLTADTGKKFTEGKKPLTLERVKGVLLGAAEHTLNLMVEVIHARAMGSLSAAELELVVLAKLELATIQKQRHLSTTSAEVVVSAMEALRQSEIFTNMDDMQLATPPRPSSMKGSKQKSRGYHPLSSLEEESSIQFQYQNFQSRSRLDARLWLDCRLALVKCLVGHVQGMGVIGNAYASAGLDCREHCMQGLTEAEVCGDVEMQAEFLFQGALLDLQEGRAIDDIKHTFEDVVSLLSNQQTLSSPTRLLLALAKIQFTDLQALGGCGGKEKGIIDYTLKAYTEAHEILLSQMLLLGQKVEHHLTNPYLSTPANPLCNLYLPHLHYLAKVKLRIGHALARQAASSRSEKMSNISDVASPDAWITCAGVLGTTLTISRVCVRQDVNLVAETLLHLGKVQRQLAYCGVFKPRAAVQTLMESINCSMAGVHDLGLIRQAYLEVALLYLASSLEQDKQAKQAAEAAAIVAAAAAAAAAAAKQEESKVSASDVKKRGRRPSSPKVKSRSISKAPQKKSPDPDQVEKDFLQARDQERAAAWTAIRMATLVAMAQRTRSLLIGDPALTALEFKASLKDQVPDFALQDLLSLQSDAVDSSVGQYNHTTQLEPVEEVLQDDALSDDKSDNVSPQPPTSPVSTKTSGLSWVHLLGYTAILQRMCSLDSVGVGKEGKSQNDDPAGFEVGGESLETGINHDVVRSPLLSTTAMLRLNSMLDFLHSHLIVFAEQCLALKPPANLILPTSPPVTALCIPTKSYAENIYIPQKADTAPKILALAKEDHDKSPVAATDNELCMQWYQPAFEVSAGVSKEVVLLFAVGQTPGRTSPTKGKLASSSASHVLGKLTVPLGQLVDLHGRLAELRQKGDISLSDKIEKPKPPSVPIKESSSKPASKKSRRTARITQLSAKVKKDDDLEMMLRQCIQSTQELLTGVEDGEEAQATIQIPFEVELANIQNFEQLFDPSYGHWLKGTKLYKWLVPILQQDDKK